MANLYVRIHAPEGQPIDDIPIYWSDPDTEETEGEFDQESSCTVFHNLPETSAFDLRIERSGTRDLWVTLDLDERPFRQDERHFARGRPRIMTLRRELVDGWPLTFALDVTLYEPQEVILCAGRDTHGDGASPFPNFAIRRFARMIRRRPTPPQQGIVQVNPSCVLTLFEFNQDNSRVHCLLPGRGTLDLAGSRRRRPAYMMKSFTPTEWREYVTESFDVDDSNDRRSGRLSIVDVYDYLELIGQDGSDRRGTVMALEFLSHAYGIGPVLEGTSRTRDEMGVCNELCPVDCMHGDCGMPTPRAPWRGEPGGRIVLQRFEMDYVPERSIRQERGVKTSLKLVRRAHVVSHNPLPGAIVHLERDPSDLDPRNTDFTPGIMHDDRKEDIRYAFHGHAHLRVWGCHNGDMGPRWREAMTHINGPDNRLLAIESDKSGSYHSEEGAVRYGYHQLWRVRRRDLKFLYYSLSHRSYAQALATALGRPCYAALPGTGANFEHTPGLGGMEVDSGMAGRIRRFVAGLANFNEQDEARYYRFEPNVTRYDESIKVLLAGFVPFRMPESAADREDSRRASHFARYNSAQLAVAKVRDLERSSDERNRVRGHVAEPPWINLSLEVDAQPNVNVIWPEDLPRTEVRDRRYPECPDWIRADIQGSEALAERAHETQADIVVIVGGSPNLTMISSGSAERRIEADLRVELFARNYGVAERSAGQPALDNNRFRLDQTGPLFPREPDRRVTTVPLRTWAYVVKNLREAGFTVHIPQGQITIGGEPYTLLTSAGDYICNESYYRLLREAQSGSGDLPASGRWVCLVHIAALSEMALGSQTRFDLEVSELALALQKVIGTLVEEMLWAREPYGRVPPAVPDQEPVVAFARSKQ